MAEKKKRKMQGKGFFDENKEQIAQGVNQAYEATAAVGKARTVFKTIMIDFFLIVFIIIGVFLVRYQDTRTETVNGHIIDMHCKREHKSRVCNGTIEYEVAGKKYTKPINSSGRPGQIKKVRYNPNDPEDFTTFMKLSTIGWIVIGVSAFFLVMSWVWTWIVFRYKLAAAASGVGLVADMAVPDE